MGAQAAADGPEGARTLSGTTLGQPSHCVVHALRGLGSSRLPPSASIEEALAELVDGDSHAIVVEEAGHVYGILTYQSFCEAAIVAIQAGQSLDRWLRDAVVLELVSSDKRVVQPGDSLVTVLPMMESVEAVLVSDGAVLGFGDVVAYFGEKTRAMLEVERVEVGLREMVKIRIPSDQLAASISRSQADFASADPGDDLEDVLNSLSLGGLLGIFLNKENYDAFFAGLFRDLSTAKSMLLGLNDLRNQIFHFRGVTDPVQSRRLTRAANLIDTFVRRESVTRADG